jgi:hypothetical protein
MSDYSLKSIRARFAITIFFAAGAASVVLLMFLVVGSDDGQFASSGNDWTWWLGSSVRAGAYGALTGLIVDGLRYLSDLYWPTQLRFKAELGKFLTRHLA